MLVIDKVAIENLMKYLLTKPVQEVAGLLVYAEKDGNIQIGLRGVTEGGKQEAKPILKGVE